jgi:hypothetical protein
MGLLSACLLAGHWAHAAEPDGNEKKPAGIRTDFGDVLIENLGIGQTYNLRDLAGTPMKVTNTGMATVNLSMDVIVPTASFITAQRRDMGFEPIPSIGWVTLSQSQFMVPSGESAYTDVIIKIPNDPKYYGKRYQADIYSRTVGTNFLQVGVWSHLQITIVKSPEEQAQMEKNHKNGVVANMDYTLLPDKLVIENFPLGRAVDVKKEIKKTMMIANSGENAIKLRVRQVAIGDTPLSLQTGYEIPKPEWLHLKSDVIEAEASSFVDPGLSIQIPKDAAFSNKKYMFVIKVEPADPHLIGVTYYGKIYVQTQVQ